MIDRVSMTNVTYTGFTLDIVSCDPMDNKCIAVQEWIPWISRISNGEIDTISDALMTLCRDCGATLHFS